MVSVQPVQPDVLYEEVPQARPINEMTSAEAARNVRISQKCTSTYMCVHTCSVQDVSDTTEQMYLYVTINSSPVAAR